VTLAISGPHFAPGQGVDADPHATQRSLNASIAALAQEKDGLIEYVADPHRAAEDPRGKPHRTCKFKCAFCAGTTVIDQFKDDSGNWPTNEITQAKLFGWTHDAQQERWFCGATCKNRYETKMRGHGNEPLAVATSGQSTAARDLYARSKTIVDAPNAIDSQDTTPAAPPEAMRRNTTRTK
jgi:hypothetical protein